MLLIAGFWSDIDTRPSLVDGNKVYYHIYGSGVNEEVFNKAASYVRRFFPSVRVFNPSLVITGTWYKVGAYPSQTSLLNTFQIVLTTDGSRSFAFLLYHDIQWINPSNSPNSVSGQAGFNAGDGITFEMLPYSRTESIRLLPTISNVGTPGVFVFRIDSDQIDVAGCSNDSQLVFFPRRASQLGSTPITIQGPCFDNVTDGDVKCRFGESSVVDAIIIDRFKAICLVPPSPTPTQTQIYFSLDGGATYQSFYNTFTYMSADYGVLSYSVSEVVPVNLSSTIINSNTRLGLSYFISDSTFETLMNLSTVLQVELNFVRLNTSNNGISLERTILIEDNITLSQSYQIQMVNIRSYELNNLQPIFFRIVARDLSTDRIYIGLNSPVFILKDGEQSGTTYCRNWLQNQPEPSTWNTDLLPCPMTLAQARVARCCYTADESCRENSWDPTNNCLEQQAPANMSEPSAVACYFSTRTNAFSAGTECCFDQSGQLISVGRAAGSDDRYSPLRKPILHFFEDKLPFLACCHLSDRNDDCLEYYRVRPTRPGSNTWNSWGSTWGDPHFTSLDGTGYTFNGYGEYTYLAILNGSNSLNTPFNPPVQSLLFESQVRTTPLSTSGSFNQVTVIRGIAAKSNDPSAERISVTISRRELLIVQRGNETIDLNPTSDDPNAANRSIIIGYPEMVIEFNATSNVLTLSWFIGVSIQINQLLVTSVQPNKRVLGVGASVSGIYRGKTFGLLGVYDGDKNNDLQSSDGTTVGVASELTLQTIHYSFGQTWLINISRSLFYYESGDSASFYAVQSNSYVPNFSSIDPPSNLMNDARQICSINESSTNQSTWTMAQRTCYFDFAVTNDRSFAAASRDAANVATESILAQRNPPEFNSNIVSVFQVNQNQRVLIDFTATSLYTNNIIYSLVEGPSAASFDTSTGRFSWLPNASTDNNTWIRVSALDAENNLISSRDLTVRINSTPASSANGLQRMSIVLGLFLMMIVKMI